MNHTQDAELQSALRESRELKRKHEAYLLSKVGVLVAEGQTQSEIAARLAIGWCTAKRLIRLVEETVAP